MGLKPLGNQPTYAMIINELKVITIFCETDDFVKACKQFVGSKLIGSSKQASNNSIGDDIV